MFTLMQRSLLERLRDDPASVRFSEVAADANRADALNAIYLVSVVITGVAFIVWFRRAYWNLDGLGAPRRHGVGWAIVAWFCPVVNLWYPKQIADDMWKANQLGRSGGSHSAMSPPKSVLIYAWWGTWIASSILGLSIRSGDDQTVSDALSTNSLYLVRDLVLPAAAVLAILVVRRITAGQVEIVARASQLPAGR